jgi:hypothetical protein
MRYNEKKAMKQGWLLATNGATVEIQRYDESEKFESDEQAFHHVRMRSYNGDQHATFCLLQCTSPVHKFKLGDKVILNKRGIPYAAVTRG